MPNYGGRPLTQWSPALVAAAIVAVAWMVACAAMPLVGDDLAYASFDRVTSGSILEWPRWCARHWLHTNGRMANFLAPLTLYFFPRWLLTALCGAALCGWLWLMAVLARARGWRGPALVALVTVLFPWWDAMLLFDVQFNYIWASAVGLASVAWWHSGVEPHSRFLRILIALAALCAGMMHEAMSLPLCVGWIVWWLLSDKPQPRQKWFLAAFGIGAFLVTMAPGLMARAAAGKAPDDPMWLLVLKSDFLALALLVVALVARVRMGRSALVEWARQHPVMTVLAVASFVSMAISAVGGIVGRSGWFAQTYALIVFFRLLPCAVRSLKGLSALLIAALAAYWGAFAAWQVKLNGEARAIIEAYAASPDGLVYADYTSGADVPWWLLNRNRHAPDDDDFYLLYTLSTFAVREGHAPIAVLPADARQALTADNLTLPLKFRQGVVTASAPLDSMVSPFPEVERYLVRDGVDEFIVTPFTAGDRRLYFTAPRHLDPGDR